MFKRKITSSLSAQLLKALKLDEKYFQSKEISNNIRGVKDLKISVNTAIFEVLTRVQFIPLGRGEELFSLWDILRSIEDDSGLHALEDEKRTKETLARYLQISSIEGQGSYFYDVKTDRVFDCDWGEEEWMLAETKAAMFETSMDFFTWYFSKPIENHHSKATKKGLSNFYFSKQTFSRGYLVNYWLSQNTRRLSHQEQHSIELAFDEELVQAVDADLQ